MTMAEAETPRSGRTAIVTGAARGIGAASARRLAASGTAVGVLDLDQGACDAVVEQIRAAGGCALSLVADIAVEEQVDEAVKRCAAELGAPLILVNNAGIIRDNLLFKMTLEDWDSVMGVHLRGSFLMSKAVQGYMTKAGWGRIVNLSSTSALGNRGQANYSAAKAGLQGFTKTLALELATDGVTANCISPGYVWTPLVENQIPDTMKARGMTREQVISDVLLVRQPTKRFVQPAEVGAMAVFLCREEAANITGANMSMDGGWTAE